MRRDANARRDALIDAATQCFLRVGYQVPLEEIAEAAGVGRGTLYRNFRDRMALVIAVFEREIERLGQTLDGGSPIETVIMTMAERSAGTVGLFNRLAADISFDAENRAAFEALAGRLVTLFQPLVQQAHKDGTLSPAIGARQVVLAVRMIAGLLMPHQTDEDRIRIRDEVLTLLGNGLRPR